MNKFNLSHALLIAACATIVGCSKSEAPVPPPSTPNPAMAAPSLADTPSPPPATSAGDPQPATPATGPTATDNSATKPLDDSTAKKESTQMPGALDGNNHSSDSVNGETKK